MGPGVLPFSAENQEAGGLNRRFSLRPSLPYQAKDCEKKAPPSGQRM